MILDRQKFIRDERPLWRELEALLQSLETDSAHTLSLEEAQRFHYLYRRASSDLAKVETFASEPTVRTYLEGLVARAYAEIHETRRHSRWRVIGSWFASGLPQTFRRRAGSFRLACLVTIVGALFGAGVVIFDYESKAVLLPFPHLLGDPSERVQLEEQAGDNSLEGARATFSAALWAHNTRVSLLTMALGMTFGIGTAIMLFYNGVILGAVICDYVLAGETVFLAGWLLPHGAVEIPSILIAGQAGFVLGRALIGLGDNEPLRSRLRRTSPDLVTLIMALTLLLIWAGIVEAFFSQYHEPLIPYALKIGFGTVELVLLFLYLSRAGRLTDSEPGAPQPEASHG